MVSRPRGQVRDYDEEDRGQRVPAAPPRTRVGHQHPDRPARASSPKYWHCWSAVPRRRGQERVRLRSPSPAAPAGRRLRGTLSEVRRADLAGRAEGATTAGPTCWAAAWTSCGSGGPAVPSWLVETKNTHYIAMIKRNQPDLVKRGVSDGQKGPEAPEHAVRHRQGRGGHAISCLPLRPLSSPRCWCAYFPTDPNSAPRTPC